MNSLRGPSFFSKLDQPRPASDLRNFTSACATESDGALAEIHNLAQNEGFVENFVAKHQVEMQFDGRGFDVAQIGIAILGEGSEVDVGSGLMPIRTTSRLHFGWILLLAPNVSTTRARFLL